MKTIKIYIVILFSALFCSCNDFDEKLSEQEQPDYQIEKVEKIIITDKKSGSVKNISDNIGLIDIKNFLKDSTNYFPTEFIKQSGQRSTHRLDLIRTTDTLTLLFYPTSDPEKIEVGYFDPKELKDNDSFKEFKRFFINRKILNLISKSHQ